MDVLTFMRYGQTRPRKVACWVCDIASPTSRLKGFLSTGPKELRISLFSISTAVLRERSGLSTTVKSKIGAARLPSSLRWYCCVPLV